MTIAAPSATPAPPSPRYPKKLNELTREEIVSIAASYGLKITGSSGTTRLNLLTAAVYAVVILAVSWFLLGMLAVIIGFGTTGFGTTNEWLCILAAWAVVMGSTHQLWFVSVPPLTALMTLDELTKTYCVYGPGWGLKKPWETYKPEENYYNLQADLIEKNTLFLSKDGIPFNQNWSLQFSPFLPMIPLYVRTVDAAIEDGFDEVVIGALNSCFLNRAAKKVRTAVTAEELKGTLLQALEGAEVSLVAEAGTKTATVKKVRFLDAFGHTMEQRFGIVVELDTFNPPAFTAEYQQLLVASAKRAGITADAKKLAKAGVPMDHATRQVMIMNREPGVTDNATTFRIDDNLRDALGGVGEGVRQILPFVGEVAQRATQRRNRRGSGSSQGGGNNNPPPAGGAPNATSAPGDHQ